MISLPVASRLAIAFMAAGGVSIAARAVAETPQDSLRLDQIQVIGSHNSYHAGLDPAIRSRLLASAPDLVRELDYQHPPLAAQLDGGVRQLELDIYADTAGGRFARPHRPGVPEDVWPLSPSDQTIMRQPGFKVMHIPDIDQHATCQPLLQCLSQIRDWSVAHPGHVPVFVILEVEQHNDIPGGTEAEPFDAATFDALDSAIRSVFLPSQLLTPDVVRGDAPDLRSAILTKGWPTMGQARGKVVFLLDQRSDRSLYLRGHSALRGRVAFTNADPGAPDAAFTEMNDGPGGDIATLVRRHFLVRTRSDADTVEGRSGDVGRRDAMLASGAQIVSTDYPDSEPARWSGYHVGFLDNAAVRCNPVSAPADCQSRLIETPAKGDFHLERMIMVMRHGIRSPLAGQVPAGVGIAGGWPQWSGAPGDLTPHGALGMTALGTFDRVWMAEAGLVPAKACPSAGAVAIRANSSARTIASAEAFVRGFMPGCSMTVMHKPSGQPDVLFSPLDADPARFDMSAIIPQLPDADRIFRAKGEALKLLGRVLDCGPASCGFLSAPAHVGVDATGHQLVLTGPVAQASSLSEALMLSYLDGKPLVQTPSGVLDAGDLGTLSALHAGMLEAVVRPRALAEPLSREMRARLLQDLRDEGGPAFRLYMGHDDTIGPLLTMLGLHFHVPGYAEDEIPIGSALGFAVYGNGTGERRIRVFIQSQTPRALRDLDGKALPVVLYPQVPGCTEPGGLCAPEVLAQDFSEVRRAER
ncbi:Ca2+-dependent phosphoinositide-specific phospholipase C [Gluconobacter oxydans]|uniref:Ca2+-dependent phosphoinositide-specific phospholipase C n=1 Tax=Gluconobacter oxydans TaxID=442 RepID=UPI0039E9BA2A